MADIAYETRQINVLFYLSIDSFVTKLKIVPLDSKNATLTVHIQGGPKKVSLIFFAITLSTAGQFS